MSSLAAATLSEFATTADRTGATSLGELTVISGTRKVEVNDVGATCSKSLRYIHPGMLKPMVSVDSDELPTRICGTMRYYSRSARAWLAAGARVARTPAERTERKIRALESMVMCDEVSNKVGLP